MKCGILFHEFVFKLRKHSYAGFLHVQRMEGGDSLPKQLYLMYELLGEDPGAGED